MFQILVFQTQTPGHSCIDDTCRTASVAALVAFKEHPSTARVASLQVLPSQTNHVPEHEGSDGKGRHHEPSELEVAQKLGGDVCQKLPSHSVVAPLSCS